MLTRFLRPALALGAVALLATTALWISPRSVRAQEASPAVAQPVGSLRVGFVDIELIIEESRAIREALQAVDNELAEMARQADLKEREFRRQRFEIDRQERILSPDERARRREELLALQDDIERTNFELDRELARRERQIEPVLERILQIVADVAKRENYDLVLRGEVVIYGSERADLTPLVVKELDLRTDEIVGLFRLEPSEDDEPTTGSLRTRRGPGQRAEDVIPLIP